MVLTPFYLPVVGILAIFTFSYLVCSHGRQSCRMSFGLRFYSAYPYLTYPPLPPIPRLDIDSVRATRAKNGSLCDFYSLLLHVFYIMNILHLPHMLTSHTYGSIDHSDSMCYHQRVVEDINTYGSYRWCDRFFDSLFTAFQLQSDVVALSYAHRFRLCR